MKPITCTKLQYLIFSFSLLVLGTSFYLQYAKGFEPCSLCLMQRLCTILIIVLSAATLYFRRYDRSKSLVIMQLLVIAAGLFFALRQLWLLSLPDDQVPACLPGLAVLIHYFPWQDTVHALFWGSGECTKIKWKLLGLSLPMWSMLYFLFIGIANGLCYAKLDRTK